MNITSVFSRHFLMGIMFAGLFIPTSHGALFALQNTGDIQQQQERGRERLAGTPPNATLVLGWPSPTPLAGDGRPTPITTVGAPTGGLLWQSLGQDAPVGLGPNAPTIYVATSADNLLRFIHFLNPEQQQAVARVDFSSM